MDARVACRRHDEVGQHEAQHPRQGRLAVDNGHGEPEQAAAGRQFHAEQPAAEHEHAAGAPQLRPEGDGVVQAPQAPLAHQPRGGEAARAGAGGHDQAVVGQDVAVVQAQPAGQRVELYRAAAQAQLNVRGEGREQHRGGRRGAHEHGLRQRRPGVRRVRLVPDDHELAAVARLPQRLRGGRRRHAPADYDDPSHRTVSAATGQTRAPAAALA